MKKFVKTLWNCTFGADVYMPMWIYVLITSTLGIGGLMLGWWLGVSAKEVDDTSNRIKQDHEEFKKDASKWITIEKEE